MRAHSGENWSGLLSDVRVDLDASGAGLSDDATCQREGNPVFPFKDAGRRIDQMELAGQACEVLINDVLIHIDLRPIDGLHQREARVDAATGQCFEDQQFRHVQINALPLPTARPISSVDHQWLLRNRR